MKKVIIKDMEKSIHYNNIGLETPIFVKKNGRLIGMVVFHGEWFISIGGAGEYGNAFDSRTDLIKHHIVNDSYIEFYVED